VALVEHFTDARILTKSKPILEHQYLSLSLSLSLVAQIKAYLVDFKLELSRGTLDEFPVVSSEF
jgi:hypothetical protein